MKKVSFAILLLLAVVLTACGGATEPPATQPPATEPPVVQPAASDTPVPLVPVEAATPTLAPIVLVPPEMEVGVRIPYVDGSILVAVPAGEFIMGRGSSDNPVHTVSLSDYWIYRTKVTNAQYKACVAAGQCAEPDLLDNIGYNDHLRSGDPVSGVTWEQAEAYCTYVHGRLPTEAEWEKTARGPDGNVYPWGEAAPACDLLNYNNCVGATTNVRDYPQGKSYYEALDMAGNAFEWVADWYDPYYYRTGPAEDPVGPEAGTARVVRSSSYKASDDQVPSAVRFYKKPGEHSRDLGFRCVVEDPQYFAPFCEQVVDYGQDVTGSPNPGQQVQYSCPALSINVQPQQCDSNQTYVTFNYPPGDPNVVIDKDGCGDLVPPTKYVCTSPTTVSLKSLCTFSGLVEAACPVNYSLNPGTGMCEWTGGVIVGTDQCLPGYTYDPASQCCTAQPGTGLGFPLCEAGSILTEISPGHYGCLDAGSAPPPPEVTAFVNMPPACSGGDGCQPRTCSDYKASWDPQRCCCYNPFIGACTN